MTTLRIAAWPPHGFTPLAVGVAISFLTAAGLASGPTAQHFNPHKQLLLDSRVVAEVSRARLTLGRVEKEPRNPLFQADRPYENALNNLYPNVAYETDAGRFTLWYKNMLADPGVIAKMMPPRVVVKTGWYLLYATSRDGLEWAKPDLGLIGFDGSKQNNIVARDTANPGVFMDVQDPDPQRRFKMVYDLGRGHFRVRFSADGVHWSEEIIPAIVGGVGDTHNNAFYDPRTGNYVLITRLFEGERKVARSESRDFIHWTDAKVILEALPSEKGLRQTYCMPAFVYGNVYLGFLMLMNTGTDKSVDCELTWSPDSVTWHRVNAGTPLIPRGAKGSYDAGCIYGPAGGPVLKDGRLMILYGGSEIEHIGTKRHALPCWAYLRPDGFAGYEPSPPGARGIVTTQPLQCTGEPLRISADARGGSLRVTVLGEKGFELDRCDPVSANTTDGEVTWQGGARFASLKGRTVRLQFELESARLYAFSGLKQAANQ